MTEPVSFQTIESLRGRICEFEQTLNGAQKAALATVLRLATKEQVLSQLNKESSLTNSERDTFRQIVLRFDIDRVYTAKSLVVVMKATRSCNLRCKYCNAWRAGPDQSMSFEVLCHSTINALQGTTATNVEFVWHGGEVTLLPEAFFKKAVAAQKLLCRRDQSVTNSIQTNATTTNWRLYDFFKQNNFEVGVSLDGPPEHNNRQRVTRTGAPTSDAINRTIKYLQKIGQQFGALIVIDNTTIGIEPRLLLEYLASAGITQIGFLNVIPDNADRTQSRTDYIQWDAYLEYLRFVYSEWRSSFRKLLSIREFEQLENGILGRPVGMCYFAGNCMGEYITVEPDGMLCACDKYVNDKSYEYGRIVDHHIVDLLGGSKSIESHRAWQNSYRRDMSRCRWFHVCQGGCPHDRRLTFQHRGALDAGCCGWAPLIDDIAGEVRQPPKKPGEQNEKQEN